MQRTKTLLGGGRRYTYPTQVWSPAGGWWNNTPPHWQRNTVFAFGGVAVAAVIGFKISAAHERRPSPPVEMALSQVWSKHAGEDDERLAPFDPAKHA